MQLLRRPETVAGRIIVPSVAVAAWMVLVQMWLDNDTFTQALVVGVLTGAAFAVLEAVLIVREFRRKPR